MSKLEFVLEYQTIDIQKRRKLLEISNSEFGKNAKKAKDEFDKAKQIMMDSEKAAAPILAEIEAMNTQYTEFVAEFEKAEKIAEVTMDVKELEHAIEMMAKYRNKMGDMDKRIHDYIRQSKDIVDSYKVSQQNGKKAREIYTSNMAEFDALKNTHKVVLDNLDKQLAELRKKGDESLLKQYDELAKQNKLPAFVSLAGTDTCSGCGIQISQKALASLSKLDATCQCDNCGRVVFKQ